MQNRAAFAFSLVMMASLHVYMLNAVTVPKQIITVKPQKKVSPVINLQQVVIKKPEPIMEPVVEETVPEPPKPVVEKVIPAPPPVIKKKAMQKMVKKKKKKKIVKKKENKRKKLSKKIERNVSKTASKMQCSAPKQKAIKNAYLAKVRRTIEQHKKYPRTAKRMRQQGVVYVKFTISRNGKVHHIRLVKKCLHSKLNKAALKILKEIGAFAPIPKELKESTLSLTVPIRYKILH